MAFLSNAYSTKFLRSRNNERLILKDAWCSAEPLILQFLFHLLLLNVPTRDDMVLLSNAHCAISKVITPQALKSWLCIRCSSRTLIMQ